MTLWKNLFTSKSAKKNSSRVREASRQLSSTETLEQRLCLGSMQGADFAAWSTDVQHEFSQAEEILLEDRLQDDSAEATQDEPAKDQRDKQTTIHSQQTPAPSSLNPISGSQMGDPLGTSSSLQSPQQLTQSTFGSASFSSGGQASGSSVTEDSIDPSVADTSETGTAQAAQSSQASANLTASNSSGVGETSAPDTSTRWDETALSQLGLQMDENGNAYGLFESPAAKNSGFTAWWTDADEPVVIKYDFRDQGEGTNQITEQQKQLAVNSLDRWSEATGGKIVFEHDTEASAHQIINIGSGDLAQFGEKSESGGVLGLGGGQVLINEDGNFVASGIAWADGAEQWDNVLGNGDTTGGVDFSTVISHEIGHTIGLGDKAGSNATDMMYGTYSGERMLSAIDNAVHSGYFYRQAEAVEVADDQFDMLKMTDPQLTAEEVGKLLKLGSEATPSEDAIIAIVDRNGRILGVRVEQDVLDTIADVDTLVFAIDGAVAKARTAALFSNGDPGNGPQGTLAPLTSRTVRFISQSTVTQREVEGNPNVDNGSLAAANASTTRGPGFVAPIGVGAHFPPDVPFTPQVDLFAIEHTNRDSIIAPGADGIKGTADDIDLRTTTDFGVDGALGGGDDFEVGRFNIDPAFVPAGQQLYAPESYGTVQNSGLLPDAQGRGIATLPGGIPLYRDVVNNLTGAAVKDGIGDTLIGGVGVFFPGSDGFATHEQNFIAGIGQTTEERTNAAKVLESELIALLVAGGSTAAQETFGVTGAKPDLSVLPVKDIDLPFGRLDLVGIQLQVVGETAGTKGVRDLLDFGQSLGLLTGADSGTDQPLTAFRTGDDGFHRKGLKVAKDWLVTPHAGVGFTAAEVEQIILNGITAAKEVRAAVRLNTATGESGERTRMVLSVTDVNGEILGLYRMRDATTFSIDVAVAKARNVAYYADALALKPEDQVTGVTPGTALTNRTFRFLSQPRFPSGIDGTAPAPFSILREGNINRLTGENIGGPAKAGEFTTVLGHDAFFPMTNFRDDDNLDNQNGIVFFPGSMPLYKDGKLIGGLGVSGDGVDQDDVVTCYAALGFMPQENGITRADQTFVRDVRLPFQHFLRNPFG